MLSTDHTTRKGTPLARGVLDYFPDALAAVAAVSLQGSQQHNTWDAEGNPRWDKGKSTDHADCIIRHLADRGKIDSDGQPHSAKAAWRALALLQTEIDAARPHPWAGEAAADVVGYAEGKVAQEQSYYRGTKSWDEIAAEKLGVELRSLADTFVGLDPAKPGSDKTRYVVYGDPGVPIENFAKALGVSPDNFLDLREPRVETPRPATMQHNVLNKASGSVLGSQAQAVKPFETFEDWKLRRLGHGPTYDAYAVSEEYDLWVAANPSDTRY